MTEHVVYLRRAKRAFASELPSPLVGPPGPPGPPGKDGVDGKDGVTRTVVLHAGGGSSGGSGGGLIATTTISGLQSLATAGSLTPGGVYAVTDWVSGTGSLPGPNRMLVFAMDAHTPSPFVQVSTPIGSTGPGAGIFNWGTSAMVQLQDGYANVVQDSPTLGNGNIDAFPWSHGGRWYANTVAPQFQFVGGYTVTNTAMTAGFQLATCVLQSFGDLDLTGTTGGFITTTTIAYDSGVTPGPAAAISGCNIVNSFLTGFNGGTFIADSSNIIDSNVFANASVVNLSSCYLQGGSVTAAGGSQIHLLNVLVGAGGSVNCSVFISGGTGVPPTNQVINTQVDGATLTFSGTGTLGGAGRRVINCDLDPGASATVNVDPAFFSDALTGCEIGGGSAVNVDIAGSLANGRVAAGATLNTGAFNSTNVIVDGAFTVTLTAANNNTIKNGLGSTVI